jgi:arylsulfatase
MKTVSSTNICRRPNILFLLSDQHRYDWLPWTPSLRGLLHTPNLERLAARGMRFTNAVCAAPICGPSRACLASGIEYPRCGLIQHEADWPVELLGSHYQLMRDVGQYHVTGCGKFDLRKKSHDPGADGANHVVEWGFSDAVNIGGKWTGIAGAASSALDPYQLALWKAGFAELHREDYERRRGANNYCETSPTPLPDSMYVDNWVAATAESILQAIPRGRPWYCQVNFSGPHEPLDITESMADSISARGMFPPPFQPNERFDSAKHQEIRRNYSAMVENIDARIGDLLLALEASGELEQTIVIYSADHGEMLGDHGRWAKSVPFQPSVGIPFIVAGPGVQQGCVNNSPISLIDVAATVLDYAGIESPKNFESVSLRPVLEGAASSVRPVVFSGLHSWRMVFDGRHKLIRNYDFQSCGRKSESAFLAPPILYDLNNDPMESTNVADHYPGRVRRLSRMLDLYEE